MNPNLHATFLLLMGRETTLAFGAETQAGLIVFDVDTAPKLAFDVDTRPKLRMEVDTRPLINMDVNT